MPARTLASAALAASVFAANLVVLTLFLNPQATARGDGPALLLCLFLPYAVGGGAVLVALALAGHWLAPRPRAPRRPLVAGLPGFGPLVLLAVAAAAALCWLNLLSYRHSVPVESLRALAASSMAVSAAALVLLAVGVDAMIFPRRDPGPSAALAVLAAAASVAVPLALRPSPRPRPRPLPLATETVRPARRVLLVGIDGLGPEQLQAAVSGGRLPALAGLLPRGAHGALATLRPTEGPPIWTTIFTGLLPRDHGVKSFATYRLRGSASAFDLLPKGALIAVLERLGLVSRAPLTAASRQRRALWNVLNAFGIGTGVVRFWGTHPPERVQGFMLSNYFHLLHAALDGGARALHPPDLLAEVRARAVSAGDVDARLIGEFVDLSVEPRGDAVPWRRELVERALAPDLTYHRAAAVLRAAYDPPFFATYYHGLDVVGHAFTRFAEADAFGDVRLDEVRRYGRVPERYAEMLSRWVGETAQSLRSGEVLLVVSGHGMEPLPLWRRLWRAVRGAGGASGTHSSAPPGVLLAVGDGVRPGAVLGQASVLDVAPTILYLMGLPVARDMEGRVLTEIVEEEFARAHPVTFIPSYESLAVTPVTGERTVEVPPLPDEP